MWEKISGKINKKHGIIGVSFFLAVLFSLFVFQKAIPYFKQNQQVKKQIVQLSEEITQSKDISMMIKEEKELLITCQEELERARSQFNTDMKDGLFLVEFSRKLAQKEVLLNFFEPQDIIDQQTVLVLPVDLKLDGNYRRVVEVIDDLENQSNVTTIGDLKFHRMEKELESETDERVQSLTKGTVEVELLLYIYSLPTPEGRLFLDDIKNWKFGRDNPFVSMQPEVQESEGQIEVQP